MTAALVSIHDVMPETLTRTAGLLDWLEAAGVRPVTLLVVPGRGWTPAQIDTLRHWQGRGHRLAGHGWAHHVAERRGLYHRLHGALLSRNVAEHLALDGPAIAGLMARNAAWFDDHGLGRPSLYVPPAWALGPIGRARLAETPFEWVETLSGVTETATGRCRRLPLVGFEADTAVRALGAGVLNRAMAGCARHLCRRRPLRVAIHPDDLALRLAGQMRRIVDGVGPARCYDGVMQSAR